jgi:hypothetical protein
VRVVIEVSFELPKGMTREQAVKYSDESIRCWKDVLGIFDRPDIDPNTVRAELIRKPKGKQ